MKTKVLLDIDGVIAGFYSGFAQYLNRHYGTTLDPIKEPPVYDIYEWKHYLSKSDIDKAIVEWMLDDGFLKLPIYNGAIDFVYQLMDQYDVYITTARLGDFEQKLGKDTLQKIIDDTKNWFRKYGIPYDKLFFRHDKIKFCKENGIRILIEDKLKTAIKGSENGILSIVMSRPWNEKVEGENISPLLVRANSYEDILNILKDASEL